MISDMAITHRDDFAAKLKTCISKTLHLFADHSGPIVRHGRPAVDHLPVHQQAKFKPSGTYFVRRCKRSGCEIEFSNLTDIIS